MATAGKTIKGELLELDRQIRELAMSTGDALHLEAILDGLDKVSREIDLLAERLDVARAKLMGQAEAKPK